MARATAHLERGHAAAAAELLAPLLQTSLKKDDELAVRSALAEAQLMLGDTPQASATLGRSPETLRESIPPLLLSTVWRLHGRIAYARGEQSRAIALHGRALKQAEIAHDSRAIGRARYELALCYTKVADTTIVREHIAEAAAALHAAGDRRHLALVHSLSGQMLAQNGRYDEAIAALRLAERQASTLPADDVLAIICVNQSNVALIRHRYDQALALAERSVTLQEGLGQVPGLAVALATLGQICVRIGNLTRAEAVLHRALEVRSAVQFHETTGAVYDTLAQMSLMRGDYENAAEYLQRAAEAYGAYGRQTSRWYEWSVRVITARLAIRRGTPDVALTVADEIARSPAAPPAEALQGELIAIEALLVASRIDEAEHRLGQVESRLDPRSTPGAWGEFLRLRGELRSRQSRTTEAYHDIAQSSSVFELVGERYQAAVSQLALGRLASRAGARSTADRHFQQAAQVFQSLGANRDLEEARTAMSAAQEVGTGEYVGSPADADDALVRRLVDAAILPELLARELAAALIEAVSADVAVVFAELPGGDIRLIAHAGADADGARTIGRLAVQGAANGAGSLVVEPDRTRAGRAARRRGRGHAAAGRAPAAPRADDGGGGPAGVRPVRRARSPDAGRRRHHRTSARAARAGIRLRERGHAPRRRSDPTAAGQRPDRVDHRRKRHGQGAGGARDSRRLAAERRRLPALQLHHDDARAGGQPVVRASPRRVHRRGVGSARPHSDGGGRNAVSRRGRRPAAGRAAQAAAIPRVRRNHARGRDAAAARGRADHRSDQRGSRAARRRREIP
jgi:tetratricopeptide (TPR) repeat protein